MRLVAVKDLEANLMHMVLLVLVGDKVKVLDNQSSLALEPDQVVRQNGSPRYQPIYAMNREGRWLYGTQ